MNPRDSVERFFTAFDSGDVGATLDAIVSPP